MKPIKKHLKQPLVMQQMQVVVVRKVQVGLRTSTAMFPGCVPMPMRSAVSMPAVPVAVAVWATVMLTAPGPRGVV